MGPSESTLAGVKRINVEIDIFSTEVAVDNLLPIYRHSFANNGRYINDDPVFAITLSAREEDQKRLKTAEQTMAYFADLPNKLKNAADRIKAMNTDLAAVARSSSRRATNAEWVAMEKRYRVRNGPSSPATAATADTGAEGECKCSCGADHPSDAEHKALKLEVGLLKAEVEALRRQRDIFTPSVMSDSTEGWTEAKPRPRGGRRWRGREGGA